MGLPRRRTSCSTSSAGTRASPVTRTAQASAATRQAEPIRPRRARSSDPATAAAKVLSVYTSPRKAAYGQRATTQVAKRAALRSRSPATSPASSRSATSSRAVLTSSPATTASPVTAITARMSIG